MTKNQQLVLTLLTAFSLVGMLNAQSITCNQPGVQVSVDQQCQVSLTADEILEGPNANGPYTMILFLGNRIVESGPDPLFIDGVDPNGFTYTYVNNTFTAEVTDNNGNNCSSNVTFEDKLAPVFSTLDTTITVSCSDDLTCVFAPTANDNCTPATINVTESVVQNDICATGGRIIRRVYTATDQNGNVTTASQQAVVDIIITQVGVVSFPRDIQWTCEQYACYPSITNATSRSAGVNDTFDDNGDMILNSDDEDVTQGDDPITVGLVCDADDDDGFCAPFGERDSAAPACGTQSFNLTVEAGGTGISCQTPAVNGLEDDDVLAMTGSGVPNVDANSSLCMYDVSFEDDTLATCNGAIGTLKILRSWRVLNWCDNSILTDLQIIEVKDNIDPVVSVPARVDLTANVQGAGPHGLCGTSGLLPVAALSDNCSGINAASVVVNTPAGQATPLVLGGSVVGYQIPAPYLPLGGPYTVSYTAADNCGNITTVTTQVFVEDNTPPVAICDEITNLSLTGTAATAIYANTLDDGSYDDCSSVWFKVIRMDELNADSRPNLGRSTGLNCGSPNSNNPGEGVLGVLFDDEAFFCCDDIATNNNIVVVRVYDVDPGNDAVAHARQNPGGDLFGRYNDCMVEVEVEDKVAPIKLLDNPDRTIVCTDAALRQQYVDDTNVTFDAPVFQDNCDFTVSLTVIDGTTTCGDGIIRRRFSATDINGNQSVICEQRITSVLEHDYTILWPRDEDRNMCAAGVLGDTLSRPNSLIEDACDLLAVSYVDQRFATNDDACYKILRTYDVINWCEWDGFSTPVQIANPTFTTAGPRLDVVISAAGAQDVQLNFNPTSITSVGRWSYIQQIKVYDEEDPILGPITQAPCAAANVVDDVAGMGCGQTVSVDFDLIDNCGGLAPPTYRLVAFTGDANGDGTISASELAAGDSYPNDPFAGSLTAPAGSTSSVARSGTFNISGTYPLGDHVFVVTARDLCGNEAEYYVPFTAEDCKPPTPKALSFITISIMATGTVSCVAPHLDNGSFDGCGPVKLSFSANVNDTIRTFTCSEIGSNPVQLWVTDAAGNQDFANVDIIVQDNSIPRVCNPRPAIAGRLETSLGNGVENVRVTANGGYFASTTTPASGNYEFLNITSGADVTLTPVRLDQASSGITTYDLYLIGQHILGISPLTTPEAMIAADGNNNGNVSAFDITVIRRILLGLDADFSNNSSWRFIDANYSFPNPSNPWQESFPEIISYNDVVQNMMNADFTAIKVGDVNNSAQANSNQPLAPRTLTGSFALEAQDVVLAKGESTDLTFTASDIEALGYQFTLEWDPSVVEVKQVLAGTHPASGFGTHLLSEGKLTMSHDGEMTGDLFTLEVNALRDGVALSEVFAAGSSVTTAEAFAKTGAKSVELRFSGSTSSANNALEQNRPNPFAGSTQIGFTLAEAGAATLTVTDVTGRVVYRVAGQFDAGRSQVEIAAGELPSAGLLNYTLTAGDFTATRKMVVIK